MEKRRCLFVSSWTGGGTGGETDRFPDSTCPSSEVLIDDGSRALEGDSPKAAVLRGICSLALPSSSDGLLAESGDRKLRRRMSASLVCPRRRNKACIIGMVVMM